MSSASDPFDFGHIPLDGMSFALNWQQAAAGSLALIRHSTAGLLVGIIGNEQDPHGPDQQAVFCLLNDQKGRMVSARQVGNAPALLLSSQYQTTLTDIKMHPQNGSYMQMGEVYAFTDETGVESVGMAVGTSQPPVSDAFHGVVLNGPLTGLVARVRTAAFHIGSVSVERIKSRGDPSP